MGRLPIIAAILLVALTVGASAECWDDLLRVFTTNASIAYPKNYYMIDYTGKAINDLGTFDECLDLGVSNYCLLQAALHTGLTRIAVPVYVGTCVPTSCNESALNDLLTDAAALAVLLPQLKAVNFSEMHFHCHQPPEPFSGAAIFTIVLIGLIVSFVIIGTIIEGFTSTPSPEQMKSVKVAGGETVEYQPLLNPALRSEGALNGAESVPEVHKKPNPGITFLKSFAIQSNIKWLMADNTQNGESPLASLNGLRVAMMGWIILGHTMTYSILPVGFDNDVKLSKLVENLSFQVIPGAEFAVDVFFYISGFLVMYMLLKELNQKKGKIPWGLFYFHRYWRLTPVYAFIMLVYTTLTPHMVSGPFQYQYRAAKTDLCVHSWWTNLLYINNFIPKSSGAQCMGWSWFLANDMQFYIVTPIFALLFRKNRAAGFGLVGFLCVVSLVLNWVLSDHYNLKPMDPNDDAFNSIVYNKPYTRMIAYLQGILVAFLLQYEYDLTKFRAVRYVLYAAACALTWTPVYLAQSYWKYGWDKLTGLFYITFSRTGFVLGIMFVMYCMHRKHGYILRKVFSSYMWVFLARLTYTAYLLHPMIIFVQYFSTTQIFHFSPFYATLHYCTNLALAYALGFVFHLAVEKPTANLERLFLPHKKD